MNARNSDAEPASLLAALAARREATADFHTDRQLADRVLLATGWKCSPDPSGHQARVRWHFGVNPEVSCWEPTHPHPVNSVDAAIGQLPFGWEAIRMTRRNATKDGGGAWHVMAAENWPRGRAGWHKLHAEGATLAIAVCALAVQAWDLEAAVDQAVADVAAGDRRAAARENAA